MITDWLIASRDDFRQAVLSVFERLAKQEDCREVFLCDDDFSAWPLNEKALISCLERWARAHRQFHMVARSFESVMRHHPRWVAWRQHWSHIVQCRSADSLAPSPYPTLLIVPGLTALRLANSVHFRGRMTVDAADIRQSFERFDAVSQQSVDAFPTTTLGL